jgi:hypothetical protein
MAAKVGYVAVDQGARLTLETLASRVEGVWLSTASDGSHDWAQTLQARGVELLLCGTSDSTQGRSLEAGACAAATALGIPLVIVEDFPGNFVAAPDARPRLLCVESEFAARLAAGKMAGMAIHVGPAIRYDRLRRTLKALRRSTEEAESAVLWIGQPETADSLETLRHLRPALAERSVRVWLRAHPRDAGYRHGSYAGLDLEDVTSLPLEECLARRPRLVITQFSSVAIEAGFWGIPSLNVLFPDAGGRTLAAKKGYGVPPWCDEGAAFLLVDAEETGKVLDRALGSVEARNSVIQAFDRYFKVGEEGAPALINLLYNQGLL